MPADAREMARRMAQLATKWVDREANVPALLPFATALMQAREALEREIARHRPHPHTDHCVECGNAICEAEDRMSPALAAIAKLEE